MGNKIYFSINDIVERWGIKRRAIERILKNDTDPHPLIARKFGGAIRVHRDDLLDYEEHHIISGHASKRSAGRKKKQEKEPVTA